LDNNPVKYSPSGFSVIYGSTAKIAKEVAAGFSLRKETLYVNYLRNLKVAATLFLDLFAVQSWWRIGNC